MCDDGTLRDANRHVERGGGLTRREFGTGMAGAGLAALLPGEAAARGATERRPALRQRRAPAAVSHRYRR